MAEKCPPPPIGLSQHARMFGDMAGGVTASRLLAMLGNAADAAGNDPDACVALAVLVRACVADLAAAEVVESCQQDVLLAGGEVGIGEDRRLDGRHRFGADGQPAQVA